MQTALFKNNRKLHYFHLIVLLASVLTIAAIIAALADAQIYSVYNPYLRAQALGQDLVTLLCIIPLMAGAFIAVKRNRHYANFILAGGLGYLLYTYMTYSYLCYIRLLAVYIAIYALSLYGIILFLTNINFPAADALFLHTRRNKTVAWYSLIISGLIALLWLKDLITSLITGTVPAEVQLNNGASAVYANDLGFFLPAIFLSGYLLLKNKPAAATLTAVILIKEAAMGAAILGMIWVMYQQGQPVNMPMTIIFSLITVASVSLSVYFYRTAVSQKHQ